MDAHTRSEYACLEERLRTIENQGRDNLSRLGRNRGDFDYIQVRGGNNIVPAGSIGITKVATAITEIATQYDPAVMPATIDGVGWGWHYRLVAWVLIIHDSTSGVTHHLPENAIVKCISVPAVLPGPTAVGPTFYLSLYTPIVV